MTTIAVKPNTAYRYNLGSRRYIGEDGRFVSAKTVRAAVDQTIAGSNSQLQTIAKQLQAGEISLAQWQTRTAQELKVLHVAQGLAALGGVKQASQADLGYIGSLVKKQYEYLRDFAKDIASGAQKMDGSFLTRVRLYAEAGRGTYHSTQTREMRQSGAREAKRVLGPADHCQGCLEQAAKGWQPIGEVAPIGSQQCLTMCHCSIEFKEQLTSGQG